MYKKNYKILLIIFLCFVGAGCNTERGKGEFFKEGVKLFDQGEFAKAEIEIKNAIQEDPKVSDAHYYMALLNEKARKFKAMRGNLLESIKLDSSNVKAKLKLAKVYLLYNDLVNANEQTRDILNSDPENLDALSLTASIKMRGKEYENALNIVDGILQKNANHLEAISLKVVLLSKKKLFDEALALLTSALNKNEDNMVLHLLRIQVDSQRNDIDAVVADYETIAKLKPNNLQIRNALAKIYLKANQKTKAENIFRAIVKENPDKVSAKLELLNFLYVSDVNKALNQLEKFKQNNGENYSDLLAISRWLISVKLFDESENILKDIVSASDVSDTDSESALLILAKINVSSKKFENGLSYIDQILQRNSNAINAKLLKAKIFIEEDRFNEANKLLEEILWQRPGLDQALSLLGEVSILQGDLDKANENFKEAFKYNPKNIAALNFIVARAMREGHLDYAITTLENVLQYGPRQISILAKLVNLHILKSDWNTANNYIDRVKSLKKGAVFGRFLRAKLLQKQNKFEEAILAYRNILEKSPAFVDSLYGMNECYFALNQQEKMIHYLGEYIKANPAIDSAYILKSQLLSQNQKYSKALKLLDSALKEEAINRFSIDVEKARIFSVLGQKDKVYAIYNKGLEKNPNDVQLLLLLASFNEKDKQFSNSVAIYDKILKINSRHKVAKNNLATLLVDHFTNEENINKAKKLVQSFKQSKQGYYLDTYGWVQYKSGQVDEAVSIFKKVIVLEPDVAVFRYHLAVAYNDQNNSMSAVSELRQAIYLGRKKDYPERSLTEQLLEKIKNKK